MAEERGRPSKYNPEFHPADLLARMSQGELDAQIMAAWDISRGTFYNWAREHEDFKEALEKGLPKWEAAWLAKGIEYMEGGKDKAYRYWVKVLEVKGGSEYKPQTRDFQGNVTNVHINQMNVLEQKNPEELATLIKHKLEKYKDLGIVDADFKLLTNDNEPE